MTFLVTAKRPYSTNEGCLYPISKKAKHTHDIKTTSLIFPDRLLKCIMQFMEFRELLTFGATAKDVEVLAQHRWKSLRQQDYFVFNWSDCTNEVHADKWNYVLGSALSKFLEKTWFCLTDQVPAIRKRFSHLVERFPYFGNFVNFRLLSPNDAQFQEKESQTREIFLKMPLKEGGDYLLKGLYDYYHQTEGWIDLLNQAIKLNATVVGVIAIQKIKMQGDSCVDFALKAAAHEKKDFRALEIIIEKYSSLNDMFRDLYEKGHKHGPICAKLAQDEADPVKANSLWNEALTSYGDFVPLKVLVAAGKVKNQLKKWEEAHTIWHQAIRFFGSQMSDQERSLVADVKILLKKPYKEIDWVIDQLNPYLMRQYSPEVIDQFARRVVARHYDKREADLKSLLQQKKIPRNLVPDFLIAYAFIKEQKQEFLEARDLFNEAFLALGDKTPQNVKDHLTMLNRAIELSSLSENNSDYRETWL